ncbi:transglutaminase-like domain-containing protein [Bremerella cremea]|nr:transglutaminase family protein [Bremerella cremea]
MLSLRRHFAWILLLGVAGAGLAGCDSAPRGNSTNSKQNATSAPVVPSPALKFKDDVEQINSPHAEWGALFYQGEKIGFMMTNFERLKGEDGSYVRGTMVQRMVLRRDGQALDIRSENITLETLDGQLREFSTKIEEGTAVRRFVGKVSPDGKSLMITSEMTAGGKVSTDRVNWSAEYGGLLANYLLTHNPPLKSGEQREKTILLPSLNQPGMTRVEVLDEELVRMLDGSNVRLLKARLITQIPGQSLLSTTIWMDDSGEIVKSTSPIQQIETYRCSKEFALSKGKPVTFDLVTDMMVPVRGMPRVNVPLMPELTYRLNLKGSDPAEVFASQTNQVVTPIDEHTANLEVWRVRPDTKLPAALANAPIPTAEDLAASPLIEVNSPAVQSLAKLASLPEEDVWQKAVALEKFVHQTIQQKNFSQGFLSAAAVAEQKVGDCTEHSVLLIALLRANKIPARAAMGMVYVDYGGKQGFAYHMWTEAWIHDRWIPLDATRGEGGIGVDYIKVTQTSLTGSSAFAAFLPVTQVIGHLEVEVVETK